MWLTAVIDLKWQLCGLRLSKLIQSLVELIRSDMVKRGTALFLTLATREAPLRCIVLPDPDDELSARLRLVLKDSVIASADVLRKIECQPHL